MQKVEENTNGRKRPENDLGAAETGYHTDPETGLALNGIRGYAEQAPQLI